MSSRRKLKDVLAAEQWTYQEARYPGDLARDVLGNDAAVVAPIGASPRRGWSTGLAIAASLVVGLGVGVIAGRATQSGTPTVAIVPDVTPTTQPTRQPAPPQDSIEPAEGRSIAAADPAETLDTVDEDFAADANFSVVPTADATLSIVPDLATLQSVASSDGDAAIVAGPMSLLLLGAAEYAEQEAATIDPTATPSAIRTN